MPTSVVGLSTNTVVLQYDSPGSVDLTFTTMVGGILVPSSAETIIVFNTGMTTAETFGTPGTASARAHRQPALPVRLARHHLRRRLHHQQPRPRRRRHSSRGSGAGKRDRAPGGQRRPRAPAPGAAPDRVERKQLRESGHAGRQRPRDGQRRRLQHRRRAGKAHVRDQRHGELADPGLPWSHYDVCADNGVRKSRALTIGSNQNQNLTVQDLTNGTVVNAYLSGFTNSQSGTCP